MIPRFFARVLRRPARFVLVCCALLLGSCVDYEEEMWLNSDLSGRLAITLSVQEELVKGNTGLERDIREEVIRRDIERIPGVRLQSFQAFRDSGKIIEKLVIGFDSVEKLTRYETSIGEAGAVSLLGTFKIQQRRGRIVLERTVPVLPRLQGSSAIKDLFVQGLSSFLLGKNYLSYKLHLPGELITANTQRVDGQNRVVEWRFTLAQAVHDAPYMLSEWKTPAGGRALVWIASLIVAAAIAFYYLRRNRRTR